MQKIYYFIRRPIIHTVIFILGFCTLFIFQGQSVTYHSSNDPNIDRVPDDVLLFYSIHPPNRTMPFIVTGSDGYDNFNLGTDFAESFNAFNPTNPMSDIVVYNTNNGHYTIDGYNWNSTTPPVPNTAGDPYLGYDSLGNLYYITLNGSVTGTYITKSTNGGQSWGSAVTGCTGFDRETMSVDQTGGPFKGYIYCGETSGSGASFYRSTDGGNSFQSITTLSPHNLPGFLTAPGPGPTGISGGSVYAVCSYNLFYSPTYTFFRSTDGGTSFTQMSQQNGWVNTVGTQSGGRNSVNNMRVRPYPFIYADNSFGTYRGRFYVFYCANNPPGNGNKPCVYCRYSTDGGATFSSPTQVNDDASPTSSNHYQEQGWVDKTTGTVYCQWMDTRNCPTSDSAEIFASYSTNGGVSFVTNQKLSTAKMKIDCNTCPGGGSPRYQGDYTGIGSNGTTSFATWTDYRNGGFDSYGAYFPDFALKINPASFNLNNQNDSGFVFVSVPSVKLYTDKVKFTASINPSPGSGTITMTFLNKSTSANQDSLTSYPDSLRLRIKTAGGVTSQTYSVTITGHGSNGTPIHLRTFTLGISPTGIAVKSGQIPKEFSLYQNYPNPFNPTTNIRFNIAKTGNVRLVVYDITGRIVSKLINAEYTPGKYSYEFKADNYASGIYFYKLEAPGFTDIKKMILVK